MGIEVVFIPVGEPWRNGVVESFNDTYNRRFFRRQFFRSYRQLRAQSKNFELFHNRNHRYGYLQGSTPSHFLEEAGFKPLWPRQNSRYLKSPISLTGSSRSFDSFGVIVYRISGENILDCPKVWFTPMFELKSLPTYMKYRSFMERIWCSLSRTSSPLD